MATSLCGTCAFRYPSHNGTIPPRLRLKLWHMPKHLQVCFAKPVATYNDKQLPHMRQRSHIRSSMGVLALTRASRDVSVKQIGCSPCVASDIVFEDVKCCQPIMTSLLSLRPLLHTVWNCVATNVCELLVPSLVKVSFFHFRGLSRLEHIVSEGGTTAASWAVLHINHGANPCRASGLDWGRARGQPSGVCCRRGQ